jgi:VWFA-related protein
MRHRNLLVRIALVSLLVASLLGQDPLRTPGVIKINVNLVQVDAVVTDAKGIPVTDLTADDFEILQDGRPQRIRNFEFVRLSAAPVTPAAARGAGVPLPTSRKSLRADQVRRTIALVVDDIGLSFESTVRSREAMKKWIDNGMQPGDLVSIVRTNSAMGAIQQFTDNKQLLYQALKNVKYQPGRIGVDSSAALSMSEVSVFEKELANGYLTASINAIRYVVAGLREIPGRKSIILFAENMSLTALDTQRQSIEDRLRLLTDEANRSSVVIHAIDPRGVMFTGFTASDGFQGADAALAAAAGARAEAYNSSQDGMVLLTQRTGGLFYSNNDIAGSLKREISDGDGYYLMGYQPSLGTFDPPSGAKPRFHSIAVRLTKPGLRVRSRTGFFGTPDGSLPGPNPQTRGGQLAKALVSPFTTPDIRVRLTALFGHADKEGSYVKALFHFDARDLKFAELPDGTHTAELDIGMVTIDENGATVDGTSKTWKLRVQKDRWDSVLRLGMVYSVALPIKRPGLYQLRVALRDAGSQKLGSAMQLLEVPDVKSGKLALTGIVVAADPPVQDSPEGNPAVRVFQAGGGFSYAYEILNVRPNPKDTPQFDAQVQLFHENELVYQSEPQRLKTESESDARRLAVGGKLQLTKIPPGDYVMQVTITDSRKKDKNRVAVQSIDFEIK